VAACPNDHQCIGKKRHWVPILHRSRHEHAWVVVASLLPEPEVVFSHTPEQTLKRIQQKEMLIKIIIE
jgi:hypothetical protein